MPADWNETPHGGSRGRFGSPQAGPDPDEGRTDPNLGDRRMIPPYPCRTHAKIPSYPDTIVPTPYPPDDTTVPADGYEDGTGAVREYPPSDKC